jgi:hypothetical protein
MSTSSLLKRVHFMRHDIAVRNRSQIQATQGEISIPRSLRLCTRIQVNRYDGRLPTAKRRRVSCHLRGPELSGRVRRKNFRQSLHACFSGGTAAQHSARRHDGDGNGNGDGDGDGDGDGVAVTEGMPRLPSTRVVVALGHFLVRQRREARRCPPGSGRPMNHHRHAPPISTDGGFWFPDEASHPPARRGRRDRRSHLSSDDGAGRLWGGGNGNTPPSPTRRLMEDGREQ